jgi:CubicO group peptidase (beta-lactamase class C family)
LTSAGFILAGRIVEQVSGKPYEVFLQERLFGPLAMADTGYGDGGPQIAQGYATATVKAADYAAGGLYSTAADLLRWDQALYIDTPLTADSRAERRLILAVGGLIAGGWLLTRRRRRLGS